MGANAAIRRGLSAWREGELSVSHGDHEELGVASSYAGVFALSVA
jgi:hypothetical protein